MVAAVIETRSDEVSSKIFDFTSYQAIQRWKAWKTKERQIGIESQQEAETADKGSRNQAHQQR